MNVFRRRNPIVRATGSRPRLGDCIGAVITLQYGGPLDDMPTDLIGSDARDG